MLLLRFVNITFFLIVHHKKWRFVNFFDKKQVQKAAHKHFQYIDYLHKDILIYLFFAILYYKLKVISVFIF